MNHYKIAELNIEIETHGKLLANRLKKYAVKKKQPIDIKLYRIEKNSPPTLCGKPMTPELWEYVDTSMAFAEALLEHNGFCLHASAVAKEHQAVLFAAKSGTGKSTHTRLWQQYFGADKTIMINDDKPAIRQMEDGKWYVYGTPWSGKSDLNTNVKVPLKAIVILERDDRNHIEPLPMREAIVHLFIHALKPGGHKEKTEKLMDNLEKTAAQIPVYHMGCTISDEAVQLAYHQTILKSN